MMAEALVTAGNGRPVRRLLASLAAAPSAWAVQGLAGWFVAGRACLDGTPDWGAIPGWGVRLMVGGITLLALAVTVASALVGYRTWRGQVGPGALEDPGGHDRLDFLAIVALLFGVAFTVGVLWGGLPAVMVDVCEAIR
ncbi:MAG TPA: hypothetical protein VF136_07465 [Methylomirabilota bacterium]